MYYEPYQKKQRRRRDRYGRRDRYDRREPRRRRDRRAAGGCLTALLLRLLALVIVLAALAAALLYALPPTIFNVENGDSQLSLTDGLPAGKVNILLLGTDLLRQNSQRSDSIIIASVGYKSLKLTSVLRDTLVDIPGRGKHKLNAAYAYGGPELMMRTLNENFRLNIMHYIAVDFISLAEIVDALGGVDLGISEAERTQINKTVAVARRKSNYPAKDLTQSGNDTHLTGLQALGYARIRKVKYTAESAADESGRSDSDFGRTIRQRKLLNALLGKIRSNLWNPIMLFRLGKTILKSPHIRTNMSPFQLISLGEKALAAGRAGQLRLPVDGSYTDNGSSLAVYDLQSNVAAFQQFVYGN